MVCCDSGVCGMAASVYARPRKKCGSTYASLCYGLRMPEGTTYWEYIKVEQLLALQGGLEGEDALGNDEVMFIAVHQVDELWFKLAVRELSSMRRLFAAEHVPEQSMATVVRSLQRCKVLFDLATAHFALMETMTTRDYLGFRDKLMPASGFQSAQLREIEIIMGLDDSVRLPFGHASYLDALRGPKGEETWSYRRVHARLTEQPNLREALGTWLYRTPIQGSAPRDPNDAAVVRTFIEDYIHAHNRLSHSAQAQAMALCSDNEARTKLQRRFEHERQASFAFLHATELPEPDRPRVQRQRAALVFIECYRELPLLAWPRDVLDGLIALEQAFVVFRQRHARMVERVIGRRIGTGGSSGVAYLDETALRYRIFADVWAARAMLLPHTALPVVQHAERYGFVNR